MANMTALARCKHFGVSNIRGLAYMPGPSNYTKTSGPGTLYELSDFYCNIFQELWGVKNPNGWGDKGRFDLKRFEERLGINFIHGYDWAAPISQKDQNGQILKLLDHVPFLNSCARHGMKATIPISNYTMLLLSEGKATQAKENFQRIASEIYLAAPPPNRKPLPGVGMWKIFNEYELNFDRKPDHVASVMDWIAHWEAGQSILDDARLPVMVCVSFGLKDGIPGAGYMKDVWDAMQRRGKIGNYDPAAFWNERVVFATNPQNEGAFIKDYLENKLPAYWQSRKIPVPPVMFTELGSSIEQTGGEQQQAEWLAGQIAASRPGASGGMMLGACVFLNEERPWEQGPERSFGIMRFGGGTDWLFPEGNYRAQTTYPMWDPKGWWYGAKADYPVEQQAPKLNYKVVAAAWARKQAVS